MDGQIYLRDVDLDSRVATAVQDFAGDDIDDRAH